MTEANAGLEGRLARLERENRGLKLAGALLAGLCGAALLTGQAAPPGAVVASEKLTLKDARGKARLEMSADADGPARLVMLDAAGVQRVVLESWPDGRAGLSCENSGLAKLAVAADGSAFVVVRDKKGNQLFRAPQ